MQRLSLSTVRTRARRGWLLLQRSVEEFRDDHCSQMAAAIAYHLLFSLFPLAIAAVGAVGLVTQSNRDRQTVVNLVVQHVPLSAQGQQQLHQLLSSVTGASGALGLLGLLGVLWAASGVMAAIRIALNIAWDTDIRRPLLRGKLIDLVLVAASVVAVGLALAITLLTSFARQSRSHLPGVLRSLSPLAGVAVSVGAYLAAVAVIFATFLFLYRFVPAVETRLREIWPGAIVAAVGFEFVQYGFSVYVAFFAHYNRIYGTLGAVVAFLFFVYLASAVFLFGAEVASEYPRLPATGTAAAVPDRLADDRATAG